jgi:hypothetical protein
MAPYTSAYIHTFNFALAINIMAECQQHWHCTTVAVSWLKHQHADMDGYVRTMSVPVTRRYLLLRI